MEENNVNRKYKDRLFRKLFSDPLYKENLLSLFNSLHGTDYKDVDELEITTLDDVIYLNMKNDCSCILDEYMELYEQQSTFNPNMPVRGLMYYGKLYSKYISSNNINIYGERLYKMPTPRYYVFYNGDKNMPDRKVLKLSDTFKREVSDDLKYEWSALMININEGHNQELLNACQVLKDYSCFVGKTKRYSREMKIESAIRMAVDECIDEGVLDEFLLRNKSEVIEMCLTEYDEEKIMQLFKKEAYEDGAKCEQIQAVVNMLILGNDEAKIKEMYPDSFVEGKKLFLEKQNL